MRINIPGIGRQDINIEDINIEDIVGRTPKTLPKKNIPKPPVNKTKKTSPKKKRAEKKVKKRLGRSPRRSMRDIDLEEIAEIAPPKAPVVVKPKGKKKKTTPNVGRPKKVTGGRKIPPKVRVTEAKPKAPKVIKGKKTRPVRVDTTPKPKAPSVPSSKDVEKIIADLGIEIPELIDVPGVGQVKIPSVSAAPKATDIFPRQLPEMGGGRGGINPELGKRADGSTIRLMDPDAMDYIKSQEITETSASEETPTAPTPTGSYESSYIDWMESEPSKPTVRPARKLPGGGPRYKEAQEQYKEDLANWKASKPKKDDFATPAPVPVAPDPILEVSQPAPAPAPAPTPPPEPPANPFKDYVPMNILGQSFDPSAISYQKQQVADARARQTPGANIQGGGYLTYDNPILGNKQTQFGGYGQPMPTAPLMNYAGLGSNIVYAPPTQASQSQPASGATVDPNTGKIEPIGIAPPPQIRNPIT